MDRFYPILKAIPLFNQFDDNELSHMLSCLRAKAMEYKKGEAVSVQGDTISKAGIVVNGSVLAHREDINGNKKILTNYGAGEMFFEEILLSGIMSAPFGLTAFETSNIIYIDCSEISKFCQLSCIHHSNLVSNLMRMLSEKIIKLNDKIEIIQANTIREKLIAYFHFLAEQEKSYDFELPFSRQELADYLGVNRSAASRELWKMQKDGLISFNKRHFTLNKSD